MLIFHMQVATEFKLGTGVFTLSDVSNILRIDYRRVYAWWRKYWQLSKENKGQFTGDHRLDFSNLIEFYVVDKMVAAGVRPSMVFTANEYITATLSIKKPFIRRDILDAISTDGKELYLDWEGELLSLNATGQFNLSIIKEFLSRIEFSDGVAERYWPNGKESSIVIDPKIQFGQPTVAGTRIQSEQVFLMHKAGESSAKIAFLYGIKEKAIKDAIEYHSVA